MQGGSHPIAKLVAREGQPSTYNAQYHCEMVFNLCLLGATDDEIATVLHIDKVTLYNWQQQNPEFFNSFTQGKLDADARVARSLFHRAIGYEHKAVKIFKGANDQPVYAEYQEHYPPDTQAASLWLRNRQPQRWRDRTETVHEVGETLGSIIEAALEARQPRTIEHTVATVQQVSEEDIEDNRK